MTTYHRSNPPLRRITQPPITNTRRQVPNYRPMNKPRRHARRNMLARIQHLVLPSHDQRQLPTSRSTTSNRDPYIERSPTVSNNLPMPITKHSQTANSTNNRRTNHDNRIRHIRHGRKVRRKPAFSSFESAHPPIQSPTTTFQHQPIHTESQQGHNQPNQAKPSPTQPGTGYTSTNQTNTTQSTKSTQPSNPIYTHHNNSTNTHQNPLKQ